MALSLAVSEIFNVEKYCDLETKVNQGHGLSRTVSEIDGDFSRKSQNFPTPLYSAPPRKGFSLELGIGAGIKN